MEKRDRSDRLRRQYEIEDSREEEIRNRRKYDSIMSKAEFSDPIRSSDRPITRADIAEVQMDLVDLGKGKDIDEKF